MGPSADEVNNNTCAGNRILRVNGHKVSGGEGAGMQSAKKPTFFKSKKTKRDLQSLGSKKETSNKINHKEWKSKWLYQRPLQTRVLVIHGAESWRQGVCARPCARRRVLNHKHNWVCWHETELGRRHGVSNFFVLCSSQPTQTSRRTRWRPVWTARWMLWSTSGLVMFLHSGSPSCRRPASLQSMLTSSASSSKRLFKTS